MRIMIRNVYIYECHLVLDSSPSYHFTMFKNEIVCFTRQHCVAEGARQSLRKKEKEKRKKEKQEKPVNPLLTVTGSEIGTVVL